MRIKVIACKVFIREVAKVIAESEHVIDVTYIEQGLHNTPDLLRTKLQEEIDRTDAGEMVHPEYGDLKREYDAIALGYALCSNAIVGLTSKQYKLVVPRAHDCIAMLLGSRKRYREYFDAHPGTYWFSPGWIEQTLMPGEERVERLRARYAEKYGEENADYLMEMEQEWLKKYDRCTYVGWESLDRPTYVEQTKTSAEFLGWNYDTLVGDEGMFTRLLSGDWSEDEFLVVEPGETVEPSYGDGVVRACPAAAQAAGAPTGGEAPGGSEP